MPLAPGLGPAAVLCALSALVSAAVLLRAGRKGPGVGLGYPLLAGGVTAGGLILAVAFAATRIGGASRDTATVIGGILVALSAGLLVAGLLMLPGVVSDPRARVRRVLDGLLVASSGFYVTWALALEPAHREWGRDATLAPTGECLMLAGPTLLVVAALGTVAVSGLQAVGPRGGVSAVCGGAALVCVGTVGLLAVVAYSGTDRLVAALATTALCGGAALIAAARFTDRPLSPRTEPVRGGLGIGAASVIAAVGAEVVRLSVGWPFDSVSLAAALVIVSLLAVHQYLARAEIRRYAEQLASSVADFRAMAHTDALTSLANRRQLIQVLQDEAVGGPACVLLAIDLDGFKNVNDIRGHDVGDAVLVEVARRLKTNVRPGDMAARLGGDEFAVLMWARPAEATTVADRILAVLNRPYELDSGTVFVSASIGMAGCATADSIASLLRNADLALRFAKQRGKNRVERYDVAYDEYVARRTELEHELRGAVERSELMVVYQPVAEVATGRVAGVEALLRWHHPRLGTVPPAEFIPLAEETGLIHGLGEFVLHEVCHQLSVWLGDGHDLWVSINVSVRELHVPEYAARVTDVLRSHRVAPRHLVVEVTEHAVALDVEQVVERLAALRASGIRVALDDFGSGYSSLSQLRSLPVDLLKIDRQLLAPGGDADEPLVDVIVQLGTRLGLEVVAEGITEPAQRRLLMECDCGYAQGDLFGGPQPAEHVEALFTVHHVGSVDSAHEMRQS